MNFIGIIVGAAASLFVPNQTVSTILGGFAFSCFWGILEMHQQEKRVVKGWFPENPKRHEYYVQHGIHYLRQTRL